MSGRKKGNPKRGEQTRKGQGWFCAGCKEHHEDGQERFEPSPGRWICWSMYDRELNNRLADQRDTLA